MPIPLSYRPLLVVTSLILAALACARAEVALVPVTPQASTPLPPADTPTLAASNTPAPTATATLEATTAVSETAPIETATPTLEPSATVPFLPTLAVSDTPAPTDTATTAPVTTGGGFPTDATLSQAFVISFQGGVLIGRAQDMQDGQTNTWASLRAGNTYWILDLGAAQNVVGVRMVPHKDGNENVTLALIEVSADGTTWTPVYTGQGDCGVPNCDVLDLDVNVDRSFGPTSAQFIRLQAGPAPSRFAFAELFVAIVP